MATNPNISFANVINTLPKSNLQLTPQLAENLRAIIFPNEVLEEKQQALIQQISQFKTDELSGAIATKAASDIDNYRSEAMNMLKQNKGMKRLNFTPEQQAELVAKKRKLEQDINYGTQQLKTWENTLNRASRAVKDGILDESDIKYLAAWPDRTKKILDEGGSIGDVTDHMAEFAQLVSSKPQKEVTQQQLISFWETILGPVQDRYFQLPKEEIRSLFETQVSGVGAWDKTRAMHEALGYVSPTDDDITAKNKIIGILEKRWKPRKYPVSTSSKKEADPIYYYDEEKGADVYTPKTELVRTLKIDGKESKTRLLRRNVYGSGKVEWDALIEEEQPATEIDARMKARNMPYKTKKIWVEKSLSEDEYPHLKEYFDGKVEGDAPKTPVKKADNKTTTNHKDNPFE